MRNSLKITLAAATAAFFVPASACAEHHEESEMTATEVDPALAAILTSEIRKDDTARDKYRNPAETLTFMGLRADMTVGEYAPGGGWYSRVLGPYLADKGKYVGLFFNPDALPFSDDAKANIRAGAAKFPADVAGWTGLPAEKFATYTTDKVPDELKGTMDLIVIPRMMHNLLRWNAADSEIKAMRAMLKDDGAIGIIQHRAKADAPYSYTDGNKGYLREADVIAFMELNGFALADSSEINANPKDTADYEDGVWTLPPILRTAKDDPDGQDKYKAIGESDRMTLLFKKRP